MILEIHFYEAYDLLPSKYKEMLYNQNSTPTCEDLKAVWDLVQEESSFAQLFAKYARAYDPEAHKKLQDEKKRKYDEEMQRIKDQKYNAMLEKKSKENRGMVHVSYIERRKNPDYCGEHDALVARVKAQQAIDLLTKKKAKVVKPKNKFINVRVDEYISQAEMERRQRYWENYEKRKHGDSHSSIDKNRNSLSFLEKQLHNGF